MSIYSSLESYDESPPVCVWIRNPDTWIRCLEADDGINVPYKGLKNVLAPEALFLNCSAASSTTMVSWITGKHSLFSLWLIAKMLSLCCGWNASQTCSGGISVLCMAQGYVQVGFSGRASARAGCFPVPSFCVCFKLAWAEAHLLQSTAQKSACPDPCSAVTGCSSATQTHLKGFHS